MDQRRTTTVPRRPGVTTRLDARRALAAPPRDHDHRPPTAGDLRHDHVGFDLDPGRPHHDDLYIPAVEQARRPAMVMAGLATHGAVSHLAVGSRRVRAWARMDRGGWTHPSRRPEQRPTLVHVHARGSTELARLADLLRMAVTPAVVHLHEVDTRPVLRAIAARTQRDIQDSASLLLSRATLVVVPEPTQAERARKLGARRVAVAPPAAMPVAHDLCPHPARPAPWREGRRVVVVGPLTSRRLRPLVEALAAQPSDTDLILLGDGPDQTEIEANADQLMLGHRVHVQRRPTWETVDAHLQHADMVATASEVVDDTAVLLRAMELGRPVLASDVGVRRHLISSGVDGILIPAGDRWSLAGGIRRLLTDPPMAKALGEAGARRVAARGWSDVGAEILAALVDRDD